MSEAIPLVLREDLATSRALESALAKDESGAYLLGATEVLRTTIETRQGRTTIEGTITDLSTQRNREVISIEGGSPRILPEINALAKRVDEHAGNFSTRSDRALEIFTMAAESSDAQTRAKLLQNATTIDPAFGLAYIAGAESTGQFGTSFLPRGAANRKSFTALDRARFDALADRLSHAPLAVQGNAAAAVLQLAPNDLDALITLGSIRFLLGDSAGGERWLHRALELSPGNENIQQRLAEGLLETRQFPDAAKIFSRLPPTPAILQELAVCTLLQGDVARADATAGKFFSSAANPDVRALFQASWLALTGDRQRAIADLEKINPADVNLRVIVWSEIAVWQAMRSDFADATKSAAVALRQAKQPTSFGTAATLIAHANQTPDRWKQQVNASLADGEQRRLVLGYGLFLGGHYPEAAEIWRTILQQSGDADLRARAMLASSLHRAGRPAEARKIGVEPFVPDFGDLYGAISFGEMRRLLRLGS